MRMFTDLLTAALSSQGRFRVSAIVYFCEGAWLMTAAAIAVAIYGDDLTGLALVVSIAQVVFSVVASIRMLGEFSINWKSCLRSMLPAWFAALAAGACSLILLVLLPSESPDHRPRTRRLGLWCVVYSNREDFSGCRPRRAGGPGAGEGRTDHAGHLTIAAPCLGPMMEKVNERPFSGANLSDSSCRPAPIAVPTQRASLKNPAIQFSNDLIAYLTMAND